jgi:hypothetical protein
MEATDETDLRLLQTARDANERNAAALRLADRKIPQAKALLLDLIKRTDLRDQRGTLVHCLGYFDCSDQFRLMVELVISGNFEVAHEALEILELIEGMDGDEAAAALEAVEEAIEDQAIEGWRGELLSDLLEMFD